MLLEKFNFDLTKEQVLAVTVVMLGVARVDGIKPEEEAIIKGFYASVPEEMPPFDGLEEYWANLNQKIGDVVNTVEKGELLVYLSLMTAYADGHMSAAEEAFIRKVSDDVGVTDSSFAEMNEEVREELLSQLAGLPDSASVARVAAEL